MALTKTKDGKTYELIRFPMKTMNITQGNNGQFSHQGVNALDIAGKDAGIDPTFAPCKMVIKRKEGYGQGNAVFAESVDPVMFADGTVDYAKFMFLHDNYTGDFAVGRVFQQWEEFGDEGTAGYATGNHCHFEVAKGKLAWDKAGAGYGYYGRNNSTGVWHLQDSISADKACVVDGVTSRPATAWHGKSHLRSRPGVPGSNGPQRTEQQLSPATTSESTRTVPQERSSPVSSTMLVSPLGTLQSAPIRATAGSSIAVQTAVLAVWLFRALKSMV